MTEHIKVLAIIIAIGIVATVGTLFTIAYATYNPTSTAGIPFPIFNGINIGDYFATPMFTSLSVVPSSNSGTPAPAITGCTITNDVHMAATDGTDYPLSSTSPSWSPTYSVVSNPYNGKTLQNLNIYVDLYCDPSTLAQYNYYPYLTGGTVSVSLIGKDPSGNSITIFTGSQSISGSGSGSVLVNGQTIVIASFQVPASQIGNSLPQAASNYISQQNVITTGTLYFKQGQQSFQQTATHVINALYTSFGLLISPSGVVNGQITPQTTATTATISKTSTPAVYTPVAPPGSSTQSCPSNTVSIQNSCINLIQNISIAGGKTTYTIPNQSYLIYSVVINSWNQGQPYPTIKVTNLDTGISNIFTLSPNSRAAGNPIIATAGNALVVTDGLSFMYDLNNQPGRYQIQLMSVSLGGYARPNVSQDFVIYNQPQPVANCPPNYYNTGNNQCLPVPAGTVSPLPTNPPGNVPPTPIQACQSGYYMNSNNQCVQGTYNPQNIPAPGSGNSPVTLPTQSSNNVCVTLSSNGGACVPANSFLGNNPVLNSIQQLLLYLHAFG